MNVTEEDKLCRTSGLLIVLYIFNYQVTVALGVHCDIYKSFHNIL
jgi:hypothetical protein